MTYQREILIWPARYDEFDVKIINSDAIAYCDVADAAWAAYTNEPEAIFCYRDWFDRHDQQVTPYFGPTGFGSEEDPGANEPIECFEARQNAILATTVDWPEEE